MSVQVKKCKQIHHSRSEKQRNVLRLWSAGHPTRQDGHRKEKLMQIDHPWCNLKRGDMPVLRCGERPSPRDPIASAPQEQPPLSIQHSVLAPRVVSMLHCSGPCHRALLVHRALSVSHHTSRRLPCTLYMCVRNAISDSKIVSQIVQLCTVDAAVTKSPKLSARKSRAHAAFTIVCHALRNSVRLGSALNSGRSSLARRACKSSMISAIDGVSFSPHSAREH